MSLKAAAGRAARVLVVAPSTERVLALRAKLAEAPEFELAEISPADWNAAARQAQAGEVVVVDTDDGDGGNGIAESAAGVVLLVDNSEAGWVAHLLAAGARAVLRRDCNGRQLVAAVQAAAAGLSVVEPDALHALMRSSPETIELEPGDEELTRRETEVLHMMTEGLSNREIASTLGISEHTVKFHITSIFGKLGTSSRTEAVTEGIRRGLVLL